MDISERNKRYSQAQITKLQERFSNSPAFAARSDVTCYAVGSIGRLEASETSDIDAFFVSVDPEVSVGNPKLKEIELFADFIRIVNESGFPEISNDGQFLEVLSLEKMMTDFGAPSDDFDNLFTARMLLLLESRCLFNEVKYNQLMQAVLSTYFRDKEDHRDDFRPTILMNDIVRYWKTLCLNYENKRNKQRGDEHRKFQIKNIKLKYSRMLTCFGTVAGLCSFTGPINEEDVLKMAKVTPMQRIKDAVERTGREQTKLNDLEDLYSGFLKFCSSCEADEAFPIDEKQYEEAEKFSDALFAIIRDQADDITFKRLVL